jgi:hypothetical protein
MSGGVIPLRVVAQRWTATSKERVTLRCAKRRLLALNRRIGGGLLVQFAAGGHYFADMAMMLKYLPGLARDDAEDPAVAALVQLAEIREMVAEVLERVA